MSMAALLSVWSLSVYTIQDDRRRTANRWNADSIVSVDMSQTKCKCTARVTEQAKRTIYVVSDFEDTFTYIGLARPLRSPRMAKNT